MKRNYYIVALIMLIFFVISFLTNVIGPLIPDIIKVFNLSYTLAGVLPLAFFIAYGVMSVPSAIMLETFKEKKIMVAAFIVAFLGSLLLAMEPNYLSAIISLFLIGCGMAMLQVVINPLLRTSGGEENYAFTSVLAQLIFGLASFLSPLVYSYMVKALKENNSGGIVGLLHSVVPANLPWISLYWLFTVICLAVVVLLILTKFPKVELKEDEQVGSLQTHFALFKQPIVILFLVAMFCYVGTEQGIANWISQFLNTYHGLDPQTKGADTVAYFWGLMTAGGILGLFLLKIMDSRKVLISFTILALICLTAALFGPTSVALIAFPLVGFFASVMYPIIFSLALNSINKDHGSFAGLLVTAIIGGAIIPPVIGLLGDAFGLRAGMFFLYITLGYILSVGFWAKPLITNKTIDIKKKATNE
ncbi:Fucose permease [Mucilaginibacter lappiensis]|uniref:Fucose permease n=1 Tax=Mucilaginibacter lappiensis TaxID=354630 RepID=A0ABR6PQ78_9SPHI|nr:MFS transporter [Mucilaginibacter lappiensis]MBB6111932.1 fucose permease [Mucilaginibacter lappiensis]SIR90595.1 Fucose permease [Mucilaginibacter lappiensis]